MAERPPADLRPRERRGDPNVAVLLTWFLPGAGHLYLGRYGLGLTLLLVVEGLYALGWLLSRGRVFEFLDQELQGPLATILAPEVGNLGAMIAQLRFVGFGAEPSPFPPGIALGGILTSLSGVANVFVAAHAHLAARSGPTTPRDGLHPVVGALAAWAVPGLGHFLQKRRLRGAIVFFLLVFFFAWGTWLAAGSNLSRERHFYYGSGQFLLGLPAIATEILSGRPAVKGELPHVDVGLLYACMAGLLNVLAMLDVYGVAEKRWLGLETAEPVAPAEAPA